MIKDRLNRLILPLAMVAMLPSAALASLLFWQTDSGLNVDQPNAGNLDQGSDFFGREDDPVAGILNASSPNLDLNQPAQLEAADSTQTAHTNQLKPVKKGFLGFGGEDAPRFAALGQLSKDALPFESLQDSSVPEGLTFLPVKTVEQIQLGENLGQTLKRVSIRERDARAALNGFDQVFDLRKVRADWKLEVTYGQRDAYSNAELLAAAFRPNETEIISVTRLPNGSFEPSKREIQISMELQKVAGNIKSSLYQALASEAVPIGIVTKAANVIKTAGVENRIQKAVPSPYYMSSGLMTLAADSTAGKSCWSKSKLVTS